MRLTNMLKICLVFWKSGPHYAYKRYAYRRKNMYCYYEILRKMKTKVTMTLTLKQCAKLQISKIHPLLQDHFNIKIFLSGLICVTVNDIRWMGGWCRFTPSP